MWVKKKTKRGPGPPKKRRPTELLFFLVFFFLFLSLTKKEQKAKRHFRLKTSLLPGTQKNKKIKIKK
jgi:hypothetical protein